MMLREQVGASRPICFFACVATAALSLSLLGSQAAGAAGGRGSLVNFLARCTVSGEAMDDPIVHPRQPGASHDHTFFGNKHVDAFSTLQSLRGNETTCDRRSDTAAYWVPTLYRGASPIKPIDVVTYYTLRQHTPVRPYPPGLRIVAGNAHARAPQSLHIVWWTCATPGIAKASPDAPRDCGAPAARAQPRGARTPGTPGGGIQLHVRFPDCWDGRHLDSPDHHRHMAYSADGRCPAGYPVLVPSLILIVTYPVMSGAGVFLASGGQHTGHGDFFNAWKQPALARIIRDCAAGRSRCGRH